MILTLYWLNCNSTLHLVADNLSQRIQRWGKTYILRDNSSHDDLFCMVATVVDQNSRDPKPVILLSNDMFRDHEEKMRDPTLLRLWRRKHCRKHSSPSSGKRATLPPMNWSSTITPQQKEKFFEDIIVYAHLKATEAGELNAFLHWLEYVPKCQVYYCCIPAQIFSLSCSSRTGRPFTIILGELPYSDVSSVHQIEPS